MKYFSGILLFIVVVATLLFLQLNGNQKSAQKSLTLETIQADLKTNAVLVDVRTPEEFNAGHAQGAINIPLQELEKQNFGSLEKNQKIYVYCRTGNRSAQAINILNKSGHTDTIDLQSLDYWISLGGQTI